MQIDEIRKRIAPYRAELAANGVRHISVFGSVARGDDNIDSDIDLLVDFDPDARIGFVRYIELEERLSKLLERRVDLVSSYGLPLAFKMHIDAEAKTIL
jgi:predicted nucleotidyltransferase